MINKKLLFSLSFVLLAGVFYSFYTFDQKQTNSTQVEKQHPGYFEHLKKWKLSSKNEWPSQLYYKWFLDDQRLSKNGESLRNIVEMGPNNIGGRTRAILIDQNNRNKMFAGSVSGGLWVSTDAGKTWKAINDQSANLSVTDITQNPFNANEIYYSTGEPLGNSAGMPGAGVFKSSDGGQTFTPLQSTQNNSDFESLWKIEHSKTSDKVLYVTAANGQLFQSKDAGESFIEITNFGRDIYDIELLEDSTIIIAVESQGIYKAKENTLQFERKMKGIDVNFSRSEIAVCDNFPNVMYAQFGTPGFTNTLDLAGIYKSSDGGESWKELSKPNSNNAYILAWYAFMLDCHPNDSNFVMTGSVRSFYSSNGGQNWTIMDNSHADYHTAVFAGENTIFIGNDGGVYEYNRNTIGTNSIDRNNGYNVTQYYAGHYHPSQNEVIGGTQDNGTHYGTSNSMAFNQIFGGDGAYCFVHQQNPEILYLSTQNLGMRKVNIGSGSTIRLATEITSQEAPRFIQPYTMNELDGDQLYVPMPNSIWRSVNGQNFSTLSNTQLAGDPYSIGLSNDVNPTLYSGGNSTTLNRIDNAATAAPNSHVFLTPSSPQEARGGNINCVTVNSQNKGTIYLAYANISTNPRLWKVNNAATDNPNWSNISGNLPVGLPVNWIEVDPLDSTNLFAATDFGLYHSNDEGVSWFKESEIPNTSIHMLRLRKKDRKLFIYTHGRGIWMADVQSENISNKPIKKEKLTSIYPNPAKDFLNISVTKGFKPEQVLIYDMTGKIIAKMSFQEQINIQNIPNGTYFINTLGQNHNSIVKILITNN